MIRSFALLLSLVAVTACSPQEPDSAELTRLQVGQKLMLDFRYFCTDGTPSQECKTPVTTLPKELATVLREGRIGGVILFADNLQEGSQIALFVEQMQQVMRDAQLPPLFIAIDQEGGRVARLPANLSTRFGGNMALGATFEKHGTAYAEQVASGIAAELSAFGFNLNFAPTVDVNVNPQNPVINVRSYGENPKVVAALGQTTVATLQQHGIMSALKHFPGHGDTHVDSHTGLPRVDHDRATIEQVDLLPFKHIINSSTPPAMVMTAHIQYPALDNTKFVATNGEPTIVPATMSRKILTGVLREELGFNGVIVTDALDMAGIAHYYAPLEATIATFNAGADIALMPYTLRTPADIEGFWNYYKGLEQAVADDTIDAQQLKASYLRIKQLKAQYRLDVPPTIEIAERIERLEQMPFANNVNVETALAHAATTLVYDTNILPLTATQWYAVMPDTLRCQAFMDALAQQRPDVKGECLSLAALPDSKPWLEWPADAAIVVGDITPHHSLAEMGGMDDLASWRERPSKTEQHAWLQDLLAYAQTRGQNTVFVALRTPYVISAFQEVADAAVATYDYSAAVDPEGRVRSASFAALIEVLSSGVAAGTLPVSVE